jgi:hypothetical protein
MSTATPGHCPEGMSPSCLPSQKWDEANIKGRLHAS